MALPKSVVFYSPEKKKAVFLLIILLLVAGFVVNRTRLLTTALGIGDGGDGGAGDGGGGDGGGGGGGGGGDFPTAESGAVIVGGAGPVWNAVKGGAEQFLVSLDTNAQFADMADYLPPKPAGLTDGTMIYAAGNQWELTEMFSQLLANASDAPTGSIVTLGSDNALEYASIGDLLPVGTNGEVLRVVDDNWTAASIRELADPTISENEKKYPVVCDGEWTMQPALPINGSPSSILDDSVLVYDVATTSWVAGPTVSAITGTGGPTGLPPAQDGYILLGSSTEWTAVPKGDLLPPAPTPSTSSGVTVWNITTGEWDTLSAGADKEVLTTVSQNGQLEIEWRPVSSELPPIENNASKILAVNGDATEVEWVPAPSELPPIENNASKILAVNGDATEVEWVPATASTGLPPPPDGGENYVLTLVQSIGSELVPEWRPPATTMSIASFPLVAGNVHPRIQIYSAQQNRTYYQTVNPLTNIQTTLTDFVSVAFRDHSVIYTKVGLFEGKFDGINTTERLTLIASSGSTTSAVNATLIYTLVKAATSAGDSMIVGDEITLQKDAFYTLALQGNFGNTHPLGDTGGAVDGDIGNLRFVSDGTSGTFQASPAGQWWDGSGNTASSHLKSAATVITSVTDITVNPRVAYIFA